MGKFLGNIDSVRAHVMGVVEFEPYMTGDDPIIVPIGEYRAMFVQGSMKALDNKLCVAHQAGAVTTRLIAQAYRLIVRYINCHEIAASFDRRFFLREGNEVLDEDGNGPLFKRIRQLMQHYREFCNADNLHGDDAVQLGVSRWHGVSEKANMVWNSYMQARPGPPLVVGWTQMDCEVTAFIVDSIIPAMLMHFGVKQYDYNSKKKCIDWCCSDRAVTP